MTHAIEILKQEQDRQEAIEHHAKELKILYMERNKKASEDYHQLELSAIKFQEEIVKAIELLTNK